MAQSDALPTLEGPLLAPQEQHVSMATLIRQEKVREECISFTARMDRKHRPIYRLDTVQMPTFHARHQSHGVRPGGHRHRIGFLSDHNKRERELAGAHSPTAAGEGGGGGAGRASARASSSPTAAGRAASAGGLQQQARASTSPRGTAERKSLKERILEVKLTPWRKPLKRQVMRPELMELLDKLTKEQHAEYQTKVEQEMDRITGALRGKYEKLRQELDRKGVFHPEANAQRVHTMFMVQLTKCLNPEEIEDMVLEEMRSRGARSREDQEQEAIAELLEGLFHASRTYQRIKIPFPNNKSTLRSMASSGGTSGATSLAGDAHKGAKGHKKGQSQPPKDQKGQAKPQGKPQKPGSAGAVLQGGNSSKQEEAAGGGKRGGRAATADGATASRSNSVVSVAPPPEPAGGTQEASGTTSTSKNPKAVLRRVSLAVLNTTSLQRQAKLQPSARQTAEGGEAGNKGADAAATTPGQQDHAVGAAAVHSARGSEERIGDQEHVDRQIADELGDKIKSAAMRRARSGERVCEKLNDLESVDVSKPGQLVDPLAKLEAWEVKIADLVKRMEGEMREEVVEEQEFRDALAGAALADEGPDVLPAAHKRRVIKKLAQDDPAFRSFAHLNSSGNRKLLGDPRRVRTALPTVGAGGDLSHRDQNSGRPLAPGEGSREPPATSAPAGQQHQHHDHMNHQQQQEQHRSKLVGSHFHDMSYGCSRIRTALAKPDAAFINEFAPTVPTSPSGTPSCASSTRGPDCPPEGGPCPPVAVESAGTAEEGQCGNEQGSSTGETVPSVLSEDVMASGFSAGARKSLSHGEDAAVAMQRRIERVMNDLKMPTAQRLTFLQKYCDMLTATQLPMAVSAWERCAELIVVRETLLAMERNEHKVPEHADSSHVTFLDKVLAILPCPEKRQRLTTTRYWLDPEAFFKKHQQHMLMQQLSADEGLPSPIPMPGAMPGVLVSPLASPRRAPLSPANPVKPRASVCDEALRVVSPLKGMVLAWLEAMNQAVTLDLTQALIHLNNEFHDDISYKGKSYMKMFGLILR